jgi:hypothetical protein
MAHKELLEAHLAPPLHRRQQIARQLAVRDVHLVRRTACLQINRDMIRPHHRTICSQHEKDHLPKVQETPIQRLIRHSAPSGSLRFRYELHPISWTPYSL